MEKEFYSHSALVFTQADEDELLVRFRKCWGSNISSNRFILSKLDLTVDLKAHP